LASASKDMFDVAVMYIQTFVMKKSMLSCAVSLFFLMFLNKASSLSTIASNSRRCCISTEFI
jgi:hypothetical protein